MYVNCNNDNLNPCSKCKSIRVTWFLGCQSFNNIPRGVICLNCNKIIKNKPDKRCSIETVKQKLRILWNNEN